MTSLVPPTQPTGKTDNQHSIIKSIFSKKMLIVGLMGFFSGLPLLLIGSTLKAWLTESGLNLKTIGFFSLVQIPYSFKFLWAPFMDHFKFFSFGRRRGWLILSQIFLAFALYGLSRVKVSESISIVGAFAVLIAFFSASQDIVVDAYRREILDNEEQGLGSSMYLNFYRMALLFSGGFALYLADHMSWGEVYEIMALVALAGCVITWFSPEPKVNFASKNLFGSYVEPIKEFFSRRSAWIVLAFIVLYKVGESMASDMTNPFLLKLGFTKTDIAMVVKFYGFWATIAGGFVGGLLMVRVNAARALLIFGFLQSIALFGFSVLAVQGPNISLLAIVISGENFASGMAAAAAVAFMANQCDVRFSATQFSLLSSLGAVPRVLAGSVTGILAEQFGWQIYFIVCAIITVPGLATIFFLGRADKRYSLTST